MTSNTTAEVTLAALSADDSIEYAKDRTIDSVVEFVQMKHDVDPTEFVEKYDPRSFASRKLSDRLYPEKKAALANSSPSDVAKGAAMLAKLTAGKTPEQAQRELSASTQTAALSAQDRERANDLAESAMFAADASGVVRNDLEPAEYVRKIYDVNPEEYASEYDLREALVERHDSETIDRRRATLRKARKERETAELRNRVERDMAERHNPSAAQLSQDALAGTERGHRMTASARDPADFVRDEFGVEPREFDDEESLRAAIDSAEE